MSASQSSTALAGLLDDLRRRAADAGVFGGVRVTEGRLECDAAASAEPATYRVEEDGGKVWVVLVTADRWLSESIEADLMHSGDTLEELVEEELVELGVDGAKPSFEHYRSEDKLFTFRTPVPVNPTDADAAETIATWLLAYEAAFRQLGDMEADEED